ncbi:hypothetical protein MATL_G00222420 [Megalops atlanticus]|uniref:Amelotin n=1 Tax=Megalops atlanticus TaxID=7932 RepID=A0A9D3PIG5_MEGAT|nr:hypothetical protein MATL_G00222420 [Megalops atlanticus]
MIFILFLIQTYAFLVNAGAGSGSAEAQVAAMNPGMNGMNGMMMADPANPGMINAVLLNGQPQFAQLLPLSQPLIIQQPGINPIGQITVPMATPNVALQQGGLALPVAQQPMGMPQLQGQLLQAANGGTQLFAIVPTNAVGGLQVPVVNPGQQVQIVPVAGGNMMQQAAMGAQTAGNGARRVKHSVPADLYPATATPETEEDSSVPITRVLSLAKALKLPVIPKVNPTDPECSEDDGAGPQGVIPAGAVEETSGSGGALWTEMNPGI